MTRDDDAQLIDRTLDGDRAAFGQLIRRHDLAMRRLVSRLVDSRDSMDDVLQDSYLKAFRSLNTFNHRSSFATWLYSITYRTAIDHLRRKRTRRASPLDSSTLIEIACDQGHDAVERVVDRSLLKQALSGLPPDQLATVLLVEVEGLSYDDAAAVLGVASGTVGSRVNRARAALRDSMSAMTDGDVR